ncbi:flagellar basal body-associated FliL family protein [Motiliproteus sediminis]|uniref:flagellar basal body-associated FliL family protein n=1 Tax=Motiliproteus sediminis TaxID=1468178 RepID=UPI001AF01317|nr:flagellar basal body-associated FliL family protein [Motiliproteus sediminis]
MAEEQEELESPAKGGSNKLVIILVVVIVVLLGAVAAGAAWYFLSSDDEAVAEQAEDSTGKRKEAIYIKLRTLGGKPSFIANFYEPTGRQRFMQVYAEALTRDPSVQPDLEKHMPLVVHSLSTLFSNQSFTEMQTTEGKERLRQEATRKVQEILQQETGRPGIEAVYFTNFVMQ